MDQRLTTRSVLSTELMAQSYANGSDILTYEISRMMHQMSHTAKDQGLTPRWETFQMTVEPIKNDQMLGDRTELRMSLVTR